MADGIRAEIFEKIKALEEDRDNVDFSTELWTDNNLAAQKSRSIQSSVNKSNPWYKGSGKKSKKERQFNFGFTNGNGNKRKKKPVTVSDILLKFHVPSFSCSL